MQLENTDIEQLMKKVEDGQASDEEKAAVLTILNSSAEEYMLFLKRRIKELKAKE